MVEISLSPIHLSRLLLVMRLQHLAILFKRLVPLNQFYNMFDWDNNSHSYWNS